MSDLLFYRTPGAEIQQFSGQFKKVKSFDGAKGFILSSFDKTQKFIFEKKETEGVIHFNSSNDKIQSREEYLNSGNQFLNKIKTRKLSKAIFSRIKEVPSKRKTEVILRELCTIYPNTFVYLISSDLFGTWVGATPEVLLNIENGVGKTVALAGTKASNENNIWGVKEKVEQKIVSDFIEEKLLQLKVDKVQKSEVGELVAGPVKHLVTNFSFEQGATKIAEIIESIHPTPAVCGLPQKEALELINEEEQHNRSLYAGVIGYISENESKLFVNLRCAQLFENKAHLYLGGGYTKDSIVENEWTETENKAKTLLKILALNPMMTTEKSGIALFIQQCYENGMKNIVCSPGSRNAPIVIAIDEHPEMEAVVIHDERSAGFFAMGIAQQLGQPVGVVCTSGSAMLNYYPAVAEAYYQSIPLVVISADRPSEWVNQGDGQTIVQTDVYANHILAQEEIKEYANTSEEKKLLVQMVNTTFDTAKTGWKGPIHFNVPITEPLYNTVENTTDRFPILEKEREIFRLNDSEKELIETTWKTKTKKLILCGQLEKNGAVLAKLNELAVDSSLAILVENTANLKSNKFVHCIDRTLVGITESEIKAFQPDVLITMGGAIVSKKIKQFLRNSDIKEHWRIGHEFSEMDTYRALTHSFKCTPFEFMTSVLKLDLQPHISTFGNIWKQKDFVIQDKLVDYLPEVPYSDFKAIETILDYIPENSNLHMGNSSVVRYCQLFEPIASFNYFSNRGTSGIDGCTSTSAGVAYANKGKCNVILTGDIAFFYDSNALWNDNLGDNLKIVLINNSGGGIFKIIDGPSKTNQLSKYFEAKHDYKARELCKGFGIEYFEASNNDEIEQAMEAFYSDSENGRPKLIEIFTPSESNDKILKQFFNFIQS